jgi:hypothetical protein
MSTTKKAGYPAIFAAMRDLAAKAPFLAVEGTLTRCHVWALAAVREAGALPGKGTILAARRTLGIDRATYQALPVTDESVPENVAKYLQDWAKARAASVREERERARKVAEQATIVVESEEARSALVALGIPRESIVVKASKPSKSNKSKSK